MNHHPPIAQGRRGGLAAIAAGAVVLAPVLSAAPALAAPDGSDVVINEVYARGGSANQPYTTKFVELYNPTDEAISLTGLSVQYRSSSGTGATTSTVELSGSIEPGGYYLVGGGSNGDTGEALPEPDAASASLNLSGSSGTVALVDSTDAVELPTGDVAGAEVLVDLVGYGTSNTYEGSAPAETTGGNPDPQSLVRTDGVDTDDNAADFSTTETPTPQNSGGETGDPGDPGDPGEEPGEPLDVTIAEIQGTGETTPLDGELVTTHGVVTAVYPTGGLSGLYLQTPGTGGDVDEASHGIFVYSSDMAQDVAVGDHVEVTGTAGEYNGLTQLSQVDWTVMTEDASVLPVEVVYPTTDAAREALEGMLVAPQGDYTVTDTYPANRYGTVGLAAGDEPLVQPSEIANPVTDPAAFAAVAAGNAARGVILD
ncbi:lamin tail domain-containing protein, partial [Georgenia sp. 10Sc9-8]|nr:lamin tail domain-containing protein [Georgenia halotolerans]